MKNKNLKKTINSIGPIFLIFLMVSCASVGQTFKYEKRNSLILGKTTRDMAIQQLGKPTIRSIKTNSKGDFEIIQYVFAKANMSGAASRILLLEFKNKILNAKIYNSGFKDDNTQFNFFQHQAVYPSTVAGLAGKCMEETTTIWTWVHTNKSNGLDTKSIKSKSVVIAFNEEGIVTEMEVAKDL